MVGSAQRFFVATRLNRVVVEQRVKESFRQNRMKCIRLPRKQ